MKNFYNEYWLKKARKVADRVNQYKEPYHKLSDERMREKTEEFKSRYSKGESLDSILPEAFALVREASVRTVGLEPYDVQVIGALALHEGKIAEMKTGEGKTLVAAMPAYLNAIAGKGVHIVTVNDYLAERDATLMGEIYKFLGMTVGVVLNSSSGVQKKVAYACDITYVTNTELGFDYLRDNMAKSKDGIVQRDLEFAIIDEVDSILIDEARTPLIISGDGADVSKIYIACDTLAKQMKKGHADKEFNKIDAMLGEEIHETGDFIVHEKEKNITLTPLGIRKIEEFFHLNKYSDEKNLALQHVMDLALRANYIMARDKDYIVRDNAVLIVDTFTGRIMEGRQYSDGLHQAIEAKEGVEIKKETKTVATTTYQNFFRKYKKMAGMTGTAFTERKEFKSTYGLRTVVIPTNKPMIRKDCPDVVFLTKEGKFKGIVDEVVKSHKIGQPVLVGTASVKTSEELSERLTKAGISHSVLNAKQDKHEAEIIARAGKFGAVTIATNMAGRGTDIILDDESVKAGGLKVIGTEKHDAQRIDNQLRGRSGRQGDPGESVFYLSTDDDMVRLFGTDRFQKVLKVGGYDEYESVDSKMFVKSIQKAQQRVEDNHFASRKSVLDYDRVNDKQRELIYKERRKILNGESITPEIAYCMEQCVEILVEKNTRKDNVDYGSIATEYGKITGTPSDVDFCQKINGMKKKELKVWMKNDILSLHERQHSEHKEAVELHERNAMLASIDSAWMDQLRALDFLRQDINYVGYGQVDPKSQYAVQAFELYSRMKQNIYVMATYAYFHCEHLEGKETRKVGA